MAGFDRDSVVPRAHREPRKSKVAPNNELGASLSSLLQAPCPKTPRKPHSAHTESTIKPARRSTKASKAGVFAHLSLFRLSASHFTAVLRRFLDFSACALSFPPPRVGAVFILRTCYRLLCTPPRRRRSLSVVRAPENSASLGGSGSLAFWAEKTGFAFRRRQSERVRRKISVTAPAQLRCGGRTQANTEAISFLAAPREAPAQREMGRGPSPSAAVHVPEARRPVKPERHLTDKLLATDRRLESGPGISRQRGKHSAERRRAAKNFRCVHGAKRDETKAKRGVPIPTHPPLLARGRSFFYSLLTLCSF